MNTQDITHQKMDKSSSSIGLGLAIAMTLGATLGVLFAPKEGSETQKEIIDKVHELAKKFKKTRKEMQLTIENIFGKVTKELEKNYLELQGNILASLDGVKDSAELSKEKYDEIVKNVVDKFSKGKKWTDKSIKALIKGLQNELR